MRMEELVVAAYRFSICRGRLSAELIKTSRWRRVAISPASRLILACLLTFKKMPELLVSDFCRILSRASRLVQRPYGPANLGL